MSHYKQCKTVNPEQLPWTLENSHIGINHTSSNFYKSQIFYAENLRRFVVYFVKNLENSLEIEMTSSHWSINQWFNKVFDKDYIDMITVAKSAKEKEKKSANINTWATEMFEMPFYAIEICEFMYYNGIEQKDVDKFWQLFIKKFGKQFKRKQDNWILEKNYRLLQNCNITQNDLDTVNEIGKPMLPMIYGDYWNHLTDELAKKPTQKNQSIFIANYRTVVEKHEEMGISELGFSFYHLSKFALNFDMYIIPLSSPYVNQTYDHDGQSHQMMLILDNELGVIYLYDPSFETYYESFGDTLTEILNKALFRTRENKIWNYQGILRHGGFIQNQRACAPACLEMLKCIWQNGKYTFDPFQLSTEIEADCRRAISIYTAANNEGLEAV